MRRESPTWKWVDLLLGGEFDAFVLGRRATGMGWRTISHELWSATDCKVDLSHEILRRWYRDEEPTEPQAVAG